jgi:hypothetical protein
VRLGQTLTAETQRVTEGAQRIESHLSALSPRPQRLGGESFSRIQLKNAIFQIDSEQVFNSSSLSKLFRSEQPPKRGRAKYALKYILARLSTSRLNSAAKAIV